MYNGDPQKVNIFLQRSDRILGSLDHLISSFYQWVPIFGVLITIQATLYFTKYPDISLTGSLLMLFVLFINLTGLYESIIHPVNEHLGTIEEMVARNADLISGRSGKDEFTIDSYKEMPRSLRSDVKSRHLLLFELFSASLFTSLIVFFLDL